MLKNTYRIFLSSNNALRFSSTLFSKGSVLPMPSAAIILANNKWVNVNAIKGTGKGGRILKGDVLEFLKKNKSSTQATTTSSITTSSIQTQQQGTKKPQPPSYTDIPTSQMRRVIATRLLDSKQNIPHFYATADAALDNFLTFVKPKLKVSVNDFIIYCAARALEKVPECNVVYDTKEGKHKQMESIDISFAVATETGLITPIIPRTNTLSLEKLSAKVKDLSTRARENKLKPEEFQGGTFCISNLGMFGVDHFAAVINPPHGMILAVGGPIVQPKENIRIYDLDALSDGLNNNNNSSTEIAFGTFISITSASDRRAIDDSDVARFLSALKEEISLINTPIVK
jgi:pyruvate/2-oxoglutarate dehydrogenase complex dihydrolipoamide acyltransferase (E2) component